MELFAPILGSLILLALFSSMELTVGQFSQYYIEPNRKKKNFPYGIIQFVLKNLDQFKLSLQVGKIISLVFFTIIIAKLLQQLISNYIPDQLFTIFLQIIFATVIVLFTAELLPKLLTRLLPDKGLRLLALPVVFFYYIFYPATKIITVLSRLFFGSNLLQNYDPLLINKFDLAHFVKESHSGLPKNSKIENEIKIFQNALDFSKVKIRECMIPRPEIVAFPISTKLEVIKNKFIETGYSRILIFKNSIDNIVWYINSKEFFKNPKSIRSILTPIIIVPETMPANKLLGQFIKEKKSVAIVVDEFGGTGGMLTIEDLIEEIFGEIEDEHDTAELVENVIHNNEFVFSGRLEIDYLNEKYNLGIPKSEEYETLAGFILHHHESIPKINHTVFLPPFTFKILKISRNRVSLVRLKISEH